MRNKSEDLELKTALKADLDAITHIETKAHLCLDPDFDVMAPTPLAHTHADFEAFIKEKNFRVLALWEGPVLVGYTVIEIEVAGFLLHCFVIDPGFRRSALGSYMLLEVLRKMLRNKGKCLLRIYIPDYDRISQEFFKANHFSSRLVADYFVDGSDAILFTFTATEQHRKLLAD